MRITLHATRFLKQHSKRTAQLHHSMIWLKRILISLLALLLIAIIGFVAWATLGKQQPEALAQAALQPSNNVQIETDNGYTMRPGSPTDTGFIFYSGGLVTPEAYAAHLRPLAEAGYTVFAPQMPLNLAVFSLNSAEEIIADNPQIEHWVIGGHSLGGAMAAQFTLEHDAEIDGLVLWASFPADGADLSNHDILATSIYGSEDGLATVEEILESAVRLPDSAEFSEITGGNHAQFGDYGEQSGDLTATLSLSEQIDGTVQATLALLNAIEEKE